jgi:hypothetical protein
MAPGLLRDAVFMRLATASRTQQARWVVITARSAFPRSEFIAQTQKHPGFITGTEGVCRALRNWPGSLDDMTTATALAINIPLMVVFLGLWTGIPLWLVFKHPDRKPALAAPAYRRAQDTRRVAAQQGQAWRGGRLRTQVSSR